MEIFLIIYCILALSFLCLGVYEKEAHYPNARLVPVKAFFATLFFPVVIVTAIVKALHKINEPERNSRKENE